MNKEFCVQALRDLKIGDLNLVRFVWALSALLCCDAIPTLVETITYAKVMGYDSLVGMYLLLGIVSQ